MIRRAAKVDDNQAEIVAGLRKAGCTVRSLAAVGQGVPDIVVGRFGQNFLIEIKDGEKPPSKRKLTPDEQDFFDTWDGQVDVAENLTEALEIVGLYEDD